MSEVNHCKECWQRSFCEEDWKDVDGCDGYWKGKPEGVEK